MRVEAKARKRELGHVGPADEHESGSPEAGDGGGVFGRRRIVVENGRPGERAFVAHVEKILHGNRDSGERRGHSPGLAQGIHSIRGFKGCCAYLPERAEPFTGGVADPRQAPLHQVAAGHGTVPEPSGKRHQASSPLVPGPEWNALLPGHGLLPIPRRPAVTNRLSIRSRFWDSVVIVGIRSLDHRSGFPSTRRLAGRRPLPGSRAGADGAMLQA